MTFQKVPPVPSYRNARPLGWRLRPAPLPSFADWQKLAAAQYTLRSAQQLPPRTPEMVRAAKLYRLASRSTVHGERLAAQSRLDNLLACTGLALASVVSFAATEVQ